jgi:hypothetical protein
VRSILSKALLSALALVVMSGASVAAESPRVAVLDFELVDLTLKPKTPEELQRTASIRALLEQSLAARGYRIGRVDSQAQQQADAGAGYLFDRSDEAARLAGDRADWVIVGRLHKPSFLFAYLKAHVVDVKTGQLAGDLVVEVKGQQEKLTRRGVNSLAEQIDQTIKQTSSREALHPSQ